MGACKRAAELYVQSVTRDSPCRFVTVRFGNVLDSAGSVVQVFRQQIAAGGPVTVTDPRMQRFFMTIPEAARLVIQAGAIGKDGEILLLDMGSPVRIVDLAADMVRLSGLNLGDDIEIRYVGLRPGEKLFEELHSEGEKHLPTRHPKIVVADRERRDPGAVVASICELERRAAEKPDAVTEALRRMIPEYRICDAKRSAA
jgi:FlaA1/EpsC-like NDP-sugar epimerase